MRTDEKNTQQKNGKAETPKEYDPADQGFGPGAPIRRFGNTFYPSGSAAVLRAALEPEEVARELKEAEEKGK